MLEDRAAWQQCDELRLFFDACQSLGSSDYVEFDPSVIRGLDYYTGTVFEARDAQGELRAVLGGGRYDNLVADVGGDPLPGVGFAMGDVVLGLLLDKVSGRPALRPSPSEVLVANFDAAVQQETLRLAAELRQAGLRAEWYPTPDRLPKQIKYAEKQGISAMVILGPDEQAAGEVALRDLRRRSQVRVPRGRAAVEVRALLDDLGRS